MDMIVAKIDSGEIGHIHCADADCRRSLNDLDIKNVGLSRAMLEKYEQYSF